LPLDTNLTKWLSKYEGSLLESKEKTQLYGVDDDGGRNIRSKKIIRVINTEWKKEKTRNMK